MYACVTWAALYVSTTTPLSYSTTLDTTTFFPCVSTSRHTATQIAPLTSLTTKLATMLSLVQSTSIPPLCHLHEYAPEISLYSILRAPSSLQLRNQLVSRSFPLFLQQPSGSQLAIIERHNDVRPQTHSQSIPQNPDIRNQVCKIRPPIPTSPCFTTMHDTVAGQPTNSGAFASGAKHGETKTSRRAVSRQAACSPLDQCEIGILHPITSPTNPVTACLQVKSPPYRSQYLDVIYGVMLLS